MKLEYVVAVVISAVSVVFHANLHADASVSSQSSSLGCADVNLETYSLRGDSSQPKNSIDGVLAALRDHQNGVLVDARRIGDGTRILFRNDKSPEWALMDAVRLGADVDAGKANGRKCCVDIKKKYWSKYYHIDQDGKTTSNRPALLSETLKASSNIAKPGQTILVFLRDLDSQNVVEDVISAIPKMSKGLHGYLSRNQNILAKIRKEEGKSYLGMVIDPNVGSIEFLKNAGEKYYQGTRIKTAIRKYKRKRGLNRGNLSSVYWKEISGMLGKNAGIHLDIRDVENSPNIISQIKMHMLKVYTYSVNGDEYHLNVLKELKAKGGNLPDGVFISSKRTKVCESI